MGSIIELQIATITNNLRFPGQYFDEETGLHYNWNRYYDPRTGRYTQEDPIGFYSGDGNLYRYVLNNAIIYADENGFSPIGWVVKRTKSGLKKLSELKSKSDAVNARKKGNDVLATNRQKSGEIERAASEGKDVLKHKGHDLPDGSKGRPHHQTDGKPGHTFWGTSLLIIWDLLNPFDIIAGELADDELDMLKEFYNRNNPNSDCK